MRKRVLELEIKCERMEAVIQAMKTVGVGAVSGDNEEQVENDDGSNKNKNIDAPEVMEGAMPPPPPQQQERKRQHPKPTGFDYLIGFENLTTYASDQGQQPTDSSSGDQPNPRPPWTSINETMDREQLLNDLVRAKKHKEFMQGGIISGDNGVGVGVGSYSAQPANASIDDLNSTGNITLASYPTVPTPMDTSYPVHPFSPPPKADNKTTSAVRSVKFATSPENDIEPLISPGTFIKRGGKADWKKTEVGMGRGQAIVRVV